MEQWIVYIHQPPAKCYMCHQEQVMFYISVADYYELVDDGHGCYNMSSESILCVDCFEGL